MRECLGNRADKVPRAGGWLSLLGVAWALAAAIGANLSYLLLMPPLLTWALVAAVALPLLLRLGTEGYASIRTPFDLCILLSLGAGVIGLWVSPVREISLGAFQSLLAAALGYYALATCRYPAMVLRALLLLSAILLASASVFVFREENLPPALVDSTNLWAFEWGQRLPQLPFSARYPHMILAPNHGLPLVLAIALVICISVLTLSRSVRLRLACSLGTAFFSAAAVVLTSASLARLQSLESFKGRIPLWQETMVMVKQHPLSGVGLGSWAFLRNSGQLEPWLTHPHNAYLEIWSSGGALGILALLLFIGVWVMLAWRVLRCTPDSPWYGLGVGVTLGGVVVALAGVMETAPVAIPMTGADRYLYVVSPIPWLMAALLVLAHRLLTGGLDKGHGYLQDRPRSR